jgi:hypothetical protein
MCAKGEICSDEKIGYGNTKRICIPGCRKSSDCPASSPVCFNNQCGAKICEPGDSRACYDGSPETRNVGLCKAGTQYCELGGRKRSACMEQTLPQPETCDQEDIRINWGQITVFPNIDSHPVLSSACLSCVAAFGASARPLPRPRSGLCQAPIPG